METDLISLLGPAPCWIQQPSDKQSASNRAALVSDADALSQPKDSESLLDRWLAEQGFCGGQGEPSLLNGSSVRASTTPKKLDGGRASENTEAEVNSYGEPEEREGQTLFPHPTVDKSPSTNTSVSSSVAWKLQLFKAAVGIKKKHEEYEAQRRRSLSAFVRQAAQQCRETEPAEAGAPAQPEAIDNRTGALCRGLEYQKRTAAASPYTWQGGGRGEPALASYVRKARGSILTTSSVDCLQRKKEKILRRIVLLQRKQLLEAHQLRRLPSKLQVVSLLGEGASAKVWKVRHRESGEEYALKVIKKTEAHSNNSSCARVYAERHLMVRSGVSRHLAKLHAAYQDTGHLFLLQELLPGPSLFAIIQSRGRLPEEEARRYAAQLVLAVHAVHKLGFIHRDVKPENILLDKHGNAKLIDLGLAAKPAGRNFRERMQSEITSSRNSTQATTPQWEEKASSRPFPSMHACVNACMSPSSPACMHAGSSVAQPALVDRDAECKDLLPTAAVSELHAREDKRHLFVAREQLVESFASWRLRHLSERGARSAVGTLQYMAPEVAFQRASSRESQSPTDNPLSLSRANSSRLIEKGFYSKKADWWSVGAVLFECLFGHSPFGRFHFSEQAHAKRSATKNDRASGEADDKDSIQCGPETGKESAGSGVFCEPVGNPELLACMLREWKKHLKIPPPPFRIRELKKDEEKYDDAAEGSLVPPRVSREAVDLLQNLLCDEKKRFGFSRIKGHSWFKGLDWREAEGIRTKEIPVLTSGKIKEVYTKSDDIRGYRRASAPRSTRGAPQEADAGLLPRFAGGERDEEEVSAAEGSNTMKYWADSSAGTSSKTAIQNKRNNHSYHVLSGAAASPNDFQKGGGGGEERQGDHQQEASEPATSSTSETSPVCTEASALSTEEECCPPGTNRLHATPGGQEWRDLERGQEEDQGSAHARCSWLSDSRQPPSENRWLLDLRFLGFEFDRRRVHAREAARRLRAACEAAKPQSDKLLQKLESSEL